MKVSWLSIVASLAFSISSLMSLSLHAQGSAADDLKTRARQEFLSNNYHDAARDFREIAKGNPHDIYAHFFLGQSLFRLQKYMDAVKAFEASQQLEIDGEKLTLDQHRILIDQLAISYGVSGNLGKVYAILDDAVRKDPNYPLNYYNLACAFAQDGNKSKALATLSTAFQHKDHVLKGEQMPDPRSDDSFQKYVHDDDFVKLMKQIGYN